MAVIDRHRVARLIELSAAERTLKGPERLLRERTPSSSPTREQFR